MDTLKYYNINAKDYFDKTVNADMSKAYEFFLKYVKSGRILDLGCGSGRDALYFKKLGFDVTAIDGSEEMCKLAREYTGLDVKCLNFNKLRTIGYYDGIWASASLLHVDRRFLINVLIKVKDALKQNGYVYIAMKNGSGDEITPDGRYYNYLTKDEFLTIAARANLDMVDFYSSKSVSNPEETKYWNSFILKKMKR